MDQELKKVYLKAKRDAAFLAELDLKGLTRPVGFAPDSEKENFARYYQEWLNVKPTLG